MQMQEGTCRLAICRDYSYAAIKHITAIRNPLKFPSYVFTRRTNSSLSNLSHQLSNFIDDRLNMFKFGF